MEPNPDRTAATAELNKMPSINPLRLNGPAASSRTRIPGENNRGVIPVDGVPYFVQHQAKRRLGFSFELRRNLGYPETLVTPLV